ncbi:hypothetical protein RvY_04072 [Ramazzottius varieornatus]|uniref:Insulin-like domain-containing protein n=1 Tax=Ramazzottius varieornatus TaxID=947166 RepID=A0A1D1UQC1_RAMVA|nr:hypothetical protein RvY_04072 [Ramazzottius varieornatus]
MAHQLRMFVLPTLVAFCVGVFLLETAGAGPVAPVPVKNTGVSKSMVVIFPIRKDNVFDCGAELLRQINQYCIVNFDMRGIDMNIPSGNVQQLGPDGKPAPILSPFTEHLLTEASKKRILVKCCHMGCTHNDMSSVCPSKR